MSEWTKVVTDPLGLAGFALFLTFAMLARVKKNGERQWIFPLACTMAVIALAGGLLLSHERSKRENAEQPLPNETKPMSAPSSNPIQQVNQVDQETEGPGSPTVQGVQGNVTINVDQSNGTSQDAKKKQTGSKTGQPSK